MYEKGLNSLTFENIQNHPRYLKKQLKFVVCFFISETWTLVAEILSLDNLPKLDT